MKITDTVIRFADYSGDEASCWRDDCTGEEPLVYFTEMLITKDQWDEIKDEVDRMFDHDL